LQLRGTLSRAHHNGGMAVPKIRLKLRGRLRQLRRKQGLTQEKVAELAGLDARYYQKLESRRPTAVKIDTLDRLAKAFKISCSKLLDF